MGLAAGRALAMTIVTARPDATTPRRTTTLTSAKARKIQELRQARGISVDELSHRIGVDAATVQRWESDEEEPGEGALSQLADALGVSQDALRHEGDAEHHPH
jgi:ribosome-binding protein aMBF1 (putative translation factor)